MLTLFFKGGPVMWPLLAASMLSLAVTIERMIAIFREKKNRSREIQHNLIRELERGSVSSALRAGNGSTDLVARTLSKALQDPGSFASEMTRTASSELKRLGRGLTVLDTVITLAPLLGLLGTVTGMIHAFGLLGASELDAPAAITGGIAEALIATAFGLAIAICTLVPFNFLNSMLEEFRHDLEDAGSRAEQFVNRIKPAPESDECVHYGSKQAMTQLAGEN